LQNFISIFDFGQQGYQTIVESTNIQIMIIKIQIMIIKNLKQRN